MENILFLIIILVSIYVLSNSMPEKYDWIKTSIPLILTVLFSLYGDVLKRAIAGPKLKVSFRREFPFIKDIQLENGIFEKIIRLKIENSGKMIANNVYGRIKKISYKKGNIKNEFDDSTILDWSGYHHGERINLGLGDFEFLNLILQSKGEQFFFIGTDSIPNRENLTKYYKIFNVKNQPFILHISIYSENTKAKQMKYRLYWENTDDYETMTIEEIES